MVLVVRFGRGGFLVLRIRSVSYCSGHGGLVCSASVLLPSWHRVKCCHCDIQYSIHSISQGFLRGTRGVVRCGKAEMVAQWRMLGGFCCSARDDGFIVGVGSIPGCWVLRLVVGVSAGLVLSALAVCVSRIFSLSLLATVRGGTSFLCPKRQRNEAKKTLLKHATLSVHSVQFPFMGAPKARCSPEPRMFEPLLPANPDIDTLCHQCSRASTLAKEPEQPHARLRRLS